MNNLSNQLLIAILATVWTVAASILPSYHPPAPATDTSPKEVPSALLPTSPPLQLGPTLPPTFTRVIATVTPTPDPRLELQTMVAAINFPGATIVYYDITGATAQELRAQLDNLSPVAYDLYQGDAATDWYIGWNWDGFGSQDCNLQSAEVTMNIQVTLPRWMPAGDAPAQLVLQWENYLGRLVAHEAGHVAIVSAGYQNVRAAIAGSGCVQAPMAAQAALEIIRQADLEYDATSSHGTAQGAIFPGLP